MSARQGKLGKRGKPFIDATLWKKMTKVERDAYLSGTLISGKKKNSNKKKGKKVSGNSTNAIKDLVVKEVVDHDARTSAAVTTLKASGVSNSIAIVQSPTTGFFWSVGLAWVCAALQRGYLANSIGVEFPFQAAAYVVTILNSAANGSAPAAQKVPYWMKCLIDAITPTEAPFGAGQVSYKFFGSAAAPSANYEVLPPSTGIQTILYPVFAGGADMFPTAAPPGPPTLAEGELAFNDIANFMAKKDDPASKMVSFDTSTRFAKDCSVFAVQADVTGSGGFFTGGIAMQAQLEVPVFTPLLSCFVSTTSGGGGGGGRWGVWDTYFAGDPMFATNAMVQALPMKHWNMKRAPKFHFIDFLEFCDVLAQWSSAIVNQYLLDPAVNVVTTEGGSQVPLLPTLQCPLTLQELTLILRNEVMVLFGLTQNGANGLQPISQSTGNFWAPYQTGTSCCGISFLGMKLPMPFIENLKSLTHRMALRNGTDPLWFYPSIGQFAADSLTSSSYQFFGQEWNGTEIVLAPFNTFAPLPLTEFLRKTTTTKGVVEEWVRTTVESPIRLPDGWSTVDEAFLFINDTNRLSQLCALWNDWVPKFASYSSTLGVLSDDGGVNVLCSINQTRYFSIGLESKQKKMQDASGLRDARMMKHKELTTTPYSTRVIGAISYQSPPLSEPSAITSQWILPILELQTQESSQSTAFTKMQAIESEPYSVSYSTTATSGLSLAIIHSTMALSMVHAKDAPPSVFDQQVMELSKQGHAGVLGEMVGGFLSAGAQALGSILPF